MGIVGRRATTAHRSWPASRIVPESGVVVRAAVGPLIDRGAGQPRLEHRPADGLLGQRSKLAGRRGAAELAERPQQVAVVLELAGLRDIGVAIVPLGVPLPDGQDQVVDREITPTVAG